MAHFYRRMDADALRAAASEQNISLNGVARRIGVKWGNFWQWMIGGSQAPRDKLRELEQILNIPEYGLELPDEVAEEKTSELMYQIARQFDGGELASMRVWRESLRREEPTLENFIHPKMQSQGTYNRQYYLAQIAERDSRIKFKKKSSRKGSPPMDAFERWILENYNSQNGRKR